MLKRKPTSRSRIVAVGSALETGLYVLDPAELREVDDELRQRAGPPPRVVDPEEIPHEVRLRISAMIDQRRFEPPRLPEIALEVVRRADDPSASSEDMALLVHRDAFLAGRLLEAANSAFYRPRDRAITRLPEAVTRMGLRQVRNVVLAAAMEQSVYRGARKELMSELWQASVGAAVGSRLTAHMLRRDPDRAFMVGLLHDVGKPVLAWCLDQVLDEVRAPQQFDELAPQIFHLLHPRVGALIVRQWKLPSGLARIVAHHHDPAPPDDTRAHARVIRIATLLYQCWRHSPEDFEEGGVLESHALMVRTFREHDRIRRLLNLFPPALEALLAG